MIIVIERVQYTLREAAVSIQSYYRRVLALPVLVPALASVLLLLDNRLPPDLGVVVLFLYWSLLVGGIPYLLFAGGFVVWARGRTDREVRGGILLSPLLYAPLLMLCVAGFLLVDGSAGSNLRAIATLGACGVLFGYGYVILAELGRVLLRPGTPAEPRPAA